MSAATQTAPFDAWSQVYDEQPNPMLALEERLLPALLPPIAGADILDAGCGTGRWLHRLEALAPHSLIGCDASQAMLHRARQKLSATTILHRSTASALPCFDRSCDLVLASFVLSYIDDLPAFAAECARILKPGGHVLLSDLHPVTSTQQGWTRGFKSEEGSIHLDTVTRTLPEIVAAFIQQGFDLYRQEEPAFGPSERFIFANTNKLAEYAKLESLPAIYLLSLRKQQTAPPKDVPHLRDSTIVAKVGMPPIQAPWSIDAKTWSTAPLVNISTQLDLSGYVLLPGLVNAHDHLEFALFPNLGRPDHAAPYNNAAEWAHEIHQNHTATIDLHLRVPLETRLWWGAIRNLLCGVTTVCHHNPLHPTLTAPSFPVRVVRDFGWSHSLTFGSDLTEAFQATPEDQPYILHAAEGTDQQSRNEILELDRHHLLDSRTVLVHGLALTPDTIDLLNTRGASLILCPTSNAFLFHQTPTNIAAVHRVALGSDSPLTSAGDLLDEVEFLAKTLPPEQLYNMVTTAPANILKLTEGQGRIAPGHPVDLIAVRDRNLSPAETLAALTFADIELVLLEGRVQLASPALYERLSPQQRDGLHPLQVSGHQRWLRAPLPALFAFAEHVLGKLSLGNKEVRCSSTT
jgi:cytosine/adenosine deaminase-related metal-dependent hydrolase/ubiquinone/menaquinone biosynthesis C-methylase UbiE